GVQTLEDIFKKIINGFEFAFKEAYPLKNILLNMESTLKGLKPEITIDSLSKDPSVSLNLSFEDKKNIDEIMSYINLQSKKSPGMLVLEEVQDIAKIPSAQAILRGYFQVFQNVPIIVMGSMRHLLSEMFSHPNAPLANFGYDIQINPIDYKLYQKYMNDRFKVNGLKINLATSTELQNMLNRVPEAINMVCFEIQLLFKNQLIGSDDVVTAIQSLLYKRHSRFQYFLSHRSASERRVLAVISKFGHVLMPSSKGMINETRLTARSLILNFTKLYDEGVIEQNELGYYISDPLLNYFIGSKKHI
ncbi:MAG: hypothetical protein VW397_03375, partial [Candidatus Margulisiibacteriota bacterium]